MPTIYCGKSLGYTGNDNFMTQKETWELIKDFIPKDKKIWESFYGDGKSGQWLKELGFDVIHQDIDFFENNLGECIVSNPPFGKKKRILSTLYERNTPFILIMPYEVIFYKYFDKFKTKDLQLIIPKRRIHFIKEGELKKFNFDCVFFCWKMNLENDLNFV